jgi:hypothetical protein
MMAAASVSESDGNLQEDETGKADEKFIQNFVPKC